MRHKKIFSRKGTLSQYSERAYMESDRTFDGTQPKPPKPQPKPQPPPLTGCEFISLGNYSGHGIYIIYDPLNNSATSVLLKSMLDMNNVLANNVVGTAPHYVTGNILGFNGTCSKWGNIVTGFLNLTSAGGGNFHRYMYVKLEVDPITPDIFFHSYYLPDPSNTSAFKHCTPIGGCSVSATVDLWDCDALVPGVVPGIYEITYNQQTSTWTDQFLFDLGTGISVSGDMVYRSSDNTIFIMCYNSSTGMGGVRHYTYNGTLLNEIWGTVMSSLGSYTMYCYDGEIYFLDTIGNIHRVDENPFAVVLVVPPPTFQVGIIDTTGGDGATDSACCNQPPPPNPCLDPNIPFNQMPYAYKQSWMHWYWLEYTGSPPFFSPPLTFTFGQWSFLHDLWNTESSTNPPWVNYPLVEFQQPFWGNPDATFGGGPATPFVVPVMQPSGLMTPGDVPNLPIGWSIQNLTANLDYPNQATFCEYCNDWAHLGNITGTGQWIGTPNTWGVVGTAPHTPAQQAATSAIWAVYLQNWGNPTGQSGLVWTDANQNPYHVNQAGALTYSNISPYPTQLDAEVGCECCPKDAIGNYTSIGLDPGGYSWPIPPTGTWMGPSL